MALEDVKIFIESYTPLFILAGVLLIPTLIHFGITGAGYTSPFFIKALAIDNWFKGVIGVTAGILFGFLLNKKFPSE